VLGDERARRYMNRKPYNKLEKEDQDLVEKHIGMGEPAQIRTALFNNMNCCDVGEGAPCKQLAFSGSGRGFPAVSGKITTGRADHPPGRDERKKGFPVSVLLPSSFLIPSIRFFLRLSVL
jgi:hypothetical protein